MGDILVRSVDAPPPEETDEGTCLIFDPPMHILERTWEGVAIEINQRYEELQNLIRWSRNRRHVAAAAVDFLVGLERTLDEMRTSIPCITRCVNPFVSEAVVFQHLRLRRHAVARWVMRSLLSYVATLQHCSAYHNTVLRPLVDAYNGLCVRARTQMTDDRMTELVLVEAIDLLRDTEAALAIAPPLFHIAFRLLFALIDHLREDVTLYRLYQDARNGARLRHDPSVVPSPPRTEHQFERPPHSSVRHPTFLSPPLQRTHPSSDDPPSISSRFVPSYDPSPIVPITPRLRPPILVPRCDVSMVDNLGLEDGDGAPDNVTCAVCMDAASGPRLPCGHKVMCNGCTASVDRCPLCRDRFQPAEVSWNDSCQQQFFSPSFVGEGKEEKTVKDPTSATPPRAELFSPSPAKRPRRRIRNFHI